MMCPRPAPLVALALTGWLVVAAAMAPADTPRSLKVVVEFRQSGMDRQQALDAGGRVVIREKGGTASRARIGADSSETRVTTSTGLFTVVQDGGEAMLSVSTLVPAADLAFYQQYAVQAGHVGAGVVFREVGTGFRVRASVALGDQIHVRLTPTLGYRSPSGGGAIDIVEATTELVVPAGRPVVIAGVTTSTHEVTRRMLGLAERQGRAQVTVVLTVSLL